MELVNVADLLQTPLTPGYNNIILRVLINSLKQSHVLVLVYEITFIYFI